MLYYKQICHGIKPTHGWLNSTLQSVSAGDVGDFLVTYLSREKRVFCTVRVVFKTIFNFPSNFMWLFILSFVWNLPKTIRVTLFELNLCYISSQNHQEKVWVFSSSLHILYFEYYLLAFLSCHCILRHTVFEHFILRLLGMVGCVWCWFHLLSYYLSHCANLCSMLGFVGFHTHLVYGFGIFLFYSVCECECLSMSEALDCLSYITMFLCCHNMCVLLSWGYFF